MSLYDEIQKKYIDARKNQDKFISIILNVIISDLKYEMINKNKNQLEDSDVIDYLRKTIKIKKENLIEYEKAGRNDLIEKENKEIEYINSLLPAMLSEEELKNIIIQTKQEINANSASDMGRLMKEVMQKVKGRAEGSEVRKLVNEILK